MSAAVTPQPIDEPLLVADVCVAIFLVALTYLAREIRRQRRGSGRLTADGEACTKAAAQIVRTVPCPTCATPRRRPEREADHGL